MVATSRSRRRTGNAPVRRRRQSSTAASGSRWRQHVQNIGEANKGIIASSKKVRRGVRRRARSRGALFGVFSLVIAATAVTLITLGAVSQVTAYGLGLVGEGLAFGAAWIVGERKDGSSPAKTAIAKAKARAGLCGAPTENNGPPCRNRGNCPHHRGAKGGTKGTGGKPGGGTPRGRKPAGGGPTHQSSRNSGGWTKTGRQTANTKTKANTNPKVNPTP